MEASEMSALGPVERIRKTRIVLWSIVTLAILSAASIAMFHQWVAAQLQYRECLTDREQIQVTTKDLSGAIADLIRTSSISPNQQEQLLDGMSAVRAAQDNAGVQCHTLSLGGSLKSLIPVSNAFEVTPVPAFSQDSVQLVIVVVISAVMVIYFLMCVFAAIFATEPGKLKVAEDSLKTLAGFGVGVLMAFLGFGH